MNYTNTGRKEGRKEGREAIIKHGLINIVGMWCGG
jgi:hypothetical protein